MMMSYFNLLRINDISPLSNLTGQGFTVAKIQQNSESIKLSTWFQYIPQACNQSTNTNFIRNLPFLPSLRPTHRGFSKGLWMPLENKPIVPHAYSTGTSIPTLVPNQDFFQKILVYSERKFLYLVTELLPERTIPVQLQIGSIHFSGNDFQAATKSFMAKIQYHYPIVIHSSEQKNLPIRTFFPKSPPFLWKTFIFVEGLPSPIDKKLCQYKFLKYHLWK